MRYVKEYLMSGPFRVLLLLAAGVVFLFKPEFFLAFLTLTGGVMLLVESLPVLFTAFKMSEYYPGWKIYLVKAVAGIVVGIIMIANPVAIGKVGSVFITVVLGVIFMISGILTLHNLKRTGSDASRFNGIAVLIIGLLFIFTPLSAHYFFVRLIGVLLLAGGVLLGLWHFKKERS